MTAITKRHICGLTLHQRAPAGGGEARITITTQDEDRYGDILVPEGADLTAYERNPVVLFGHETSALPVARTVHLSIEPGKGIVADFEWLKNDPFADRVRNAFEQHVLNGASVGFIPKKSEPLKSGYRYTAWELVEWSLVSTPANSNAVRTLKSLRLDGPAPLARAAVVLDQLTQELKAGRVLSQTNENRLRQASDLLSQVLAQVDEDDEKGVIVVNDGTMRVSTEALESAVASFVEDEIARKTGVRREPPVLLMRQPDGAVLKMTEAELTDFIKSVIPTVISDTLARMGGRVD